MSDNRKQRRIQLTYVKKNDIWDVYNLKNRGDVECLYIPRGEFSIDGLEDEIGVRTVGGIYLNSDTVFCKYIKRLINNFEERDEDDKELMLAIFLSNVFNTNMLERTYKSDVNADKMFRDLMVERYGRVDEKLLVKMWSYINIQEFADVVLKKNYSLYSIQNWSRGSYDL